MQSQRDITGERKPRANYHIMLYGVYTNTGENQTHSNRDEILIIGKYKFYYHTIMAKYESYQINDLSCIHNV